MIEPKAVLFDLDETLMARGQAMRLFAERLRADYGAAFAVKEPDAVIRIVLAADGGGYRPKQEMYEEIVPFLGWKGAPEWPEFREYYRRIYPACAVPEEGMSEILRYFQKAGLKLGLLTNGESRVQYAKIDLLGLREAFDRITVSEEAGCKKPDPRIFAMTLEPLGVRAEEAWYVGDHPHNDIFGAKAAGLTAVWKRGSQPWDDALPVQPDAVITRLQELETLYELNTFASQ